MQPLRNGKTWRRTATGRWSKAKARRRNNSFPRELARSLALVGLLLLSGFGCDRAGHSGRETQIKLQELTYDTSLVGDPVRIQIEDAKNAVLEASNRSETAAVLANRWRDLGMLLHAHQLRLAALKAYQEASHAAPEDADLAYLLGLVQLDLSAPNEAVTAFEKVLKIRPSDIMAQYQLAELAKNQGRLKEAAALYEKVLAGNDQFTAAFLGLGEVAMQLGETQKAEAALESALRIQPAISRAHYLLAQIYRDSGQLEKSEQALAKQREGSASVPIRDSLREQVRALAKQGEQWVQRGDSAMRAGNVGEALDAYTQAIAYSPRDFVAMAKLGNAHLQNGNSTKAREFYQKALAINPNNALLLFNLGSTWMEVGNFKEAQTYFESALKVEDLNEIRMRLADCQRLQGQWSEAKATYTALLTKLPDFLPAAMGQAVCFLAENDPVSARNSLQKAWAASEENPVVGRVLVRILAGYPALEARNGARALDILTKIEAGVPRAEFLELKAMALAENKRFADAQKTLAEAEEIAKKKGDQASHLRYQSQMQAYRQNQPWHQALPMDHPLFRQSTF